MNMNKQPMLGDDPNHETREHDNPTMKKERTFNAEEENGLPNVDKTLTKTLTPETLDLTL